MRSRRLLAGAFFITLALSATPTVAQDQDTPPSHCNTTDPNEIECLTLTVGEDVDRGEFGYFDEAYGDLDPDNLNDFNYNGTSTVYSIDGLYYAPMPEPEAPGDPQPPPRLVLVIHRDDSGIFDGSDIRLMLGTVEFSFPTGTFSADKGEYVWENPGLSWSDGDMIPVKLVRVPAVNVAPTASNGTVTTNEDTDYAFTASDFNFSDAGDALESVKIVTLPTSGELQLNNAAIGSVPQTVTAAQLGDSELKYVPPANANGTGYASFTFKVNDGELDSVADYTMTIDVTAVADTPTCGLPTLTNRRRVWQQTLTAGRHGVGSKDELAGYGWYLDTGTLAGRSAPIDLGTNSYRIGEMVLLFAPTSSIADLLAAPSGALVFHLVGETDPNAELTATEKAGLTLHVCGQAFTFASATRVGGGTTAPGPGQDRHYVWESSGLTWSDGLVLTLTLSMPASMQVAVDPPQVDGTPQVSGAGTDGSWSSGDSVKVALPFSEAVDVDISGGTPSLEIRLGGTEARDAEYLSGSGTSELVFSYTLAKSESSYSIVSVTPNSLALNSGTIRSEATQVDALLAHHGTVVQGTSSRSADTRKDVSDDSPFDDASDDNPSDDASDDPPMTAEFTQAPESHDGAAQFLLHLEFSHEPVDFSYLTVRDELFDIEGGRIEKARRLESGRNRRWEITVVPAGASAVALTARATTDCAASHAACDATGRKFSGELTLTVPGPPPAPEPEPEPEPAPEPETLEPITASWVQPPEEHDGSTAFDLHLKFSHEPVNFSYRSIEDGVVNVEGGTITRVWRWVKGRNRQWGVQVTPLGNGDVTASVNGTGECSEDHAVCDAAGRKLEAGAEVRVRGPADLSIAIADAFPNPFNSSTQIAYHLSNPGPVQLVIYNVLGQSVRTLVDQFQVAGSHRVQWDARGEQGASLSSGVYIIRLSYPGRMETQRLLYLK